MCIAALNNKCHHETHSWWHISMHIHAYRCVSSQNLGGNHLHTTQVCNLLTSCVDTTTATNCMCIAALKNKCHHETHSRWHILMRINAYQCVSIQNLAKNHLRTSYVYHLVTSCVDMPSATNYMCIAPLSNKWHQNTFSPYVSCAFTYN